MSERLFFYSTFWLGQIGFQNRLIEQYSFSLAALKKKLVLYT